MHKDYKKANSLSYKVISAAIEVHRIMGPGLLESIYEKCMKKELELRCILYESQVKVPIDFKGFTFSDTLRTDLYIDRCLIVELKDGITRLIMKGADKF